MKKIVLAGVVAAALISTSAMANVTTSATASWDASATKDITSTRSTVTPAINGTTRWKIKTPCCLVMNWPGPISTAILA